MKMKSRIAANKRKYAVKVHPRMMRMGMGKPPELVNFLELKRDDVNGDYTLPHIPTKPSRSKYAPHVGQKQKQTA